MMWTAAAQALGRLGPYLGAWDQFRHLVPLGVAGLVSSSVWLFRRTLSARYRPVRVLSGPRR